MARANSSLVCVMTRSSGRSSDIDTTRLSTPLSSRLVGKLLSRRGGGEAPASSLRVDVGKELAQRPEPDVAVQREVDGRAVVLDHGVRPHEVIERERCGLSGGRKSDRHEKQRRETGRRRCALCARSTAEKGGQTRQRLEVKT